jgi:4-amino-4-deoxy-L-arabinose transferase-like glycosyltransferase
LLLWVLVPFVFFSFSKAKLPHYILPIYPPLAILAAKTMIVIVRESNGNRKWRSYLPWIAVVVPVVYLTLGKVWPAILPHAIRQTVGGSSASLWFFGAPVIVAVLLFAIITSGDLVKQHSAYLCYCGGTAIFILLVGHLQAELSLNRSAKELAESIAPFVTPQDRLVIYDTTLEGLLYYLRVNKPVWTVWSGSKDSVMGSFYLAEKRPATAPEYGQVLFTFAEFERHWTDQKQRLLVIVKKKNLSRFFRAQDKVLLRAKGYVLVGNQ